MSIRSLLAALCLIVFTAPADAQSSSALINEALDKVYPLEINTTLPIAMKAIGEQTGVRIEAEPAVWDLLPWGEQTTINAKIQGKTLRDALELMVRKLGLVVVLGDQAVQLQPMPALARLGRRSTVQELSSLDLLATTPLDLGGERPTVRQLLDAIDSKLEALKSPFLIENRAGESARADAAVSVPRGSTLLDALEDLAKDTRATWYPWGKSILVVAKEEQVRTLLGKTINLRYNGVDVSQVLAELQQRAGVAFTIEPGAVQRIPAEYRTVRLVLDNASIRQALESLCGFTGLGYVVNESGVYLWNQSSSSSAARDPVIGAIPMDNGLQLFVHQSEVPPDVQQYFDSRRNRELQKIREQMHDEGFKPATRPATAPANADL